ncbi:MAG: hypothetical protein MMC33_007208 [Icmadophila ericetorum]|nr:hypothetical protein [Icmadophila ericetorum]
MERFETKRRDLREADLRIDERSDKLRNYPFLFASESALKLENGQLVSTVAALRNNLHSKHDSHRKTTPDKELATQRLHELETGESSLDDQFGAKNGAPAEEKQLASARTMKL